MDNGTIKMFIAGEEVVSNKEFTINEEMLSASSTILNNCYPATWELTKDYISEFYYPKDYSKFVLAKGEYQHGYDEYAIMEKTSKNLFDGITELGGYNNSGVKIPDNTMTRNANPVYVKPNTKYIISNNGVGVAMNVFEYKEDGTFIQRNLYSANVSFLTNSNTAYINFFRGSTNVDKLQVEENTTVTSYEIYNQTYLQYNTNAEKEWDNFNVYGNTYQYTTTGKNIFNSAQIGNVSGGITWKYNANSSISIQGTATGTSTNANTFSISMKKGQIYSFSLSHSLPFVLKFRISDGTHIFYPSIARGSTTRTFTPEYDMIDIRPYIDTNISSGTVIDETIFIQIEEGSTVTEYEKYTGAIPSPNPDYPQEIENVGYENLFGDTIRQGVTDYNTGNYSSNNTRVTSTEWTILPAGTYVINAKSSKNKNMVISNITFDTNGNFYNITGITGQWKQMPISFTTPIDLKWKMNIRYDDQGNITPSEIVDFQLEKGGIPHSYIPYGKYGIEITNCGKNLLNYKELTPQATNVGIMINANDEVYDTSPTGDSRGWNYGNSNWLFSLPAGTYTVSLLFSTKCTNTGGGLIVYDSSNNAIIGGANTFTNLDNKSYTFTLTEEKDIGIMMKIYNGVAKIQLEKSNQASTYEAYKGNTNLYVLDEPLRAIGAVKDKAFIENGYLRVDRYIGSVVLDGTESTWIYNSTYKIAILENYVWEHSPKNSINCITEQISNYFVGISNTWTTFRNAVDTNGMFKMQAISYRICLRNTSLTTLQQWTTWLGTNKPRIDYVLETPYTEMYPNKVTIPNSYEGDNNTFISSGLDTHTVIYYKWRNYDVLFAGIVKNSGDISLNPYHPHYCSLQILDYKTFLSESDTLDFVISNKTIAEAIEMTVNAVKEYGFVVGNINISSADDIIGAYSTLNKTAYDVLQYLAEISGSRWRARYVDSETTAIDFYDPDLMPQASDIEYTKQYWEDNNIVDITFNYGSRDYRNKQILLSDQVYGSIDYTEVVASDGYNTSFVIQNDVAIMNKIMVNGEEKTSTTTNDRQMGADADFYYTPGKNIIESNIVYPAGTSIVIVYTPLVKGRQIVFNDDEVSRVSEQTDTSGVISRYENRNDVLSSNDLQKIAQSYIKYKGEAEVIIRVTTQNKDLFNVGEVVYFNAPIDDLKKNYMVKSKATEYIINGSTVNLFYDYELTSSFNSEKAVNFFDNQRNKNSGNISEGESITRNIDLDHEALIDWTGATITEVSITIDGDNKLNSVLNSPFIE